MGIYAAIAAFLLLVAVLLCCGDDFPFDEI